MASAAAPPAGNPPAAGPGIPPGTPPSWPAPATSAADLSTKAGYFVEASSGAVSVVNATTDNPLGVIVDGVPAGGANAIGLPGIIAKAKLDGTPGTVALGTYLVVTATGTVKADPGTGARVVVARALESGSADELITAQVIVPVVYAS